MYKYLDARNRSLSIVTKFVVGMCFACVAILIAGTIEIFRRKYCDPSKTRNKKNSFLIIHLNILVQDKSSVSIYFQLLENIFMGFSEIFGMVASYEFAYFAAPRSAQSLFMSLRFCSIGVSSFIGAAYIAVFPTPSFKLDFNVSIEIALFFSHHFNFSSVELIQSCNGVSILISSFSQFFS